MDLADQQFDGDREVLERSLELSSQELLQANSDARAREVQLRQANKMEGTEYRRGESSRPVWNQNDVARDLGLIHDELHCTSVNLYGTDLQRLQAAAILAHREGLHVYARLAGSSAEDEPATVRQEA